MGRCEKQGDPGTPVIVLGDNQCHKAALKHLASLMSDQAPGHKVGILTRTSADEVFAVESPGLPAWAPSHCVPFCTETHAEAKE